MRQMAQLRTVSWSYKQRGLVATVATDTPNTSALQVFLPKGPLALLPVRDGFSNIVWSTTPAQAAELEGMTPDSFIQAVNMVSLVPFPASRLFPHLCMKAFCLLDVGLQGCNVPFSKPCYRASKAVFCCWIMMAPLALVVVVHEISLDQSMIR